MKIYLDRKQGMEAFYKGALLEGYRLQVQSKYKETKTCVGVEDNYLK